MPRAVLACLVALALLAPAAQAQTQPQLQRSLAKAMAAAGPASGAFVMDSDSDAPLFAWKPDTRRVLASNTKLFTSAAVLGRLGADDTLATSLLGAGSLQPDGTWNGDLYLRGSGDPTFGSQAFTGESYGSQATVEALASELADAGFTRINGRIFGDESLFDPLRGGPASGFRTSFDIGGPLSALDFNHGRGPSGYLGNPPLFAAQRLAAALEDDGVDVRKSARAGVTPSGAVTLAEVRSPTFARLLELQNKVSDNFFAEMLVKGLAINTRAGSPLRTPNDPVPTPPTPSNPAAAAPARAFPTPPASTRAGVRVAIKFARTLGARPRLFDGSGLSHGDIASPRAVALLLDHMRDRPDFQALYDSLPVAGSDGTLDNRMRSGPARNRCSAKTGTLIGVSALSGFCSTTGGRTVVFSILMNRVNVTGARRLQDRMVQALATYSGG